MVIRERFCWMEKDGGDAFGLFIRDEKRREEEGREPWNHRLKNWMRKVDAHVTIRKRMTGIEKISA